MEIPHYEPFYLETLDDLRAEMARLGLDIPIEEDLARLSESQSVGERKIANRFCSQPISGNDVDTDGAPGEMTFHRYTDYAHGGFGLIWIESTAAMRAGRPAQLALTEANVDRFRNLVESMRSAWASRTESPDPNELTIVLQLTASYAGATQRFPGLPDDVPLITDDAIEACLADLGDGAVLAAEAGIDGVDIQSCRGTLASRLLSAFEREGAFGGGFENRSRFLRDAVAQVRSACPDLMIATRLTAYDAMRRPYGFGVDASDYRKEDLDEPRRLVRELQEVGLDLLNVNCASPNLQGPVKNRSLKPVPDGEPPDEHPLMVLDRQLRIARTLREAAPGLPVVGSGFSWLRSFVPQVAVGAIANGAIDFLGLGRSALAYPNAPREIFDLNGMRPEATCMVCFACSILRDEKKPVGCPIRDPAVYGESFQPRQISPDQLESEARRCHFCEAAPCVAACPNQMDIPGFIRAYLEGDESRAWDIIRSSDVLPEMTAHLSPGWLQSEGACIETALNGFPVPILELQHAISWRARDRRETGVRLPDETTGKRIAVVGGGPAGIAATIRLVELGYEVDLYEQSNQLGGIPHRVIPSSRTPDFLPEIDVSLQPAIESERLRIHREVGLGADVSLNELAGESAAVLLAVGVWKERSIGDAEGVMTGLDFLEAVKQGEIGSAPERVAILAGGDSAMDAAVTALQLGARETSVVFGGPRSEMHWHLPESWFEAPGVETRMQCQPLGYQRNSNGILSGLKFRDLETKTEGVLAIDLVIEAMGLEVADGVQTALVGVSLDEAGRVRTIDGCRTELDRVYAAGGLVNGGASVGQCVAEGMRAAEAIHADLSG